MHFLNLRRSAIVQLQRFLSDCEYYDQNQVPTIFCCYEEVLRRDSTCSYSVKKLIEVHRKGYYNTACLLEAIALHLDSMNGKPFIWGSGSSSCHASFRFFLVALLTKRTVFHLMLKEMQQSMLLLVFLQSPVSNIQGNHGSSGANGG